jgi:hypothetical protein
VRHVPVEICRPVVPPHGAALDQRLLDLVHGPMRRCFGLRIGHFLGAAYRPPGPHQPTDEIGSLGSSIPGFAIRQSLVRTTK